MLCGNVARLALVCLGALLMSGVAYGAATGYDVTRVVYAHAAGTGEFRFDGAGGWTEQNPDGAFRFQERARDQNTVQLHDPARDVWILLDLNQRAILFREGSAPYSVIYTIDQAEGTGSVSQPQQPQPQQQPQQLQQPQQPPPQQQPQAQYQAPPTAGGWNADYDVIHVELYNPYPQPQNVYVDDPQRGLYYVATLPPGMTTGHEIYRGTRLVFGTEGGAAVGVYDVLEPTQYTVDISRVGGVQPPPAPAGAPPAAVAPPAVRSYEPPPVSQAPPPYQPPPVQPTRPVTLADTANSVRALAGIQGDFTNESGLPTRSYVLEPMTKTQGLEDGTTLTAYLRPDVIAWLDGGSLFFAVDMTGSSLTATPANEHDRSRGYFIDSLQQKISIPGSGSVYDFYPQNGLGSTTVSSSQGWQFSVSYQRFFGATATAAYSRTGTSSQNFDDFMSAVTRANSGVTVDWSLCNAGEVNDSMPLNQCIYRGPASLDIGGGRLARLPQSAYGFHALGAWTVFQVPYNPSQRELGFVLDVSAVMRKTWFPGVLGDVAQVGQDTIDAANSVARGQVPQPLQDVAQDVACAFDVNACRKRVETPNQASRANPVVKTVTDSRSFRYEATLDISNLAR